MEVEEPHPAGDASELERFSFCSSQYPDVKFWLGWIEDRIAAIDQLEELDRLFERALSDSPHVDIVKEFVNNAFDRLEAEIMSEDAVRKVIEKAINLCGGDILDGAYFWNRYIDLEIDELEDLIETSAPEQELRKAKEAIVSLFRRQFSLPLLGNQQSLKKLETVLSDICVQSDTDWIKPNLLLDRYKRSEELLASRILYEQNVTSDAFALLPLDDRVVAWKAYIKFELEDNQLPRAQRLYERCLLMCHESVEIWQEYLEFAEGTLKQWSLVESIANRATRAHSGVIQFWTARLLALETMESLSPSSLSALVSAQSNTLLNTSTTAAEDSNNSNNHNTDSKVLLIEAVSSTISAALMCNFPSAENYLTIMIHSCDFRRRMLHHYLQRLISPPSAPGVNAIGNSTGNGNENEGLSSVDSTVREVLKSVTSLRKAFDDADAIMHAYYPEWCAGWLQLYKYRVAVEDEIISDVIEASEEEENAEIFSAVMENEEGNTSATQGQGQLSQEGMEIQSKAAAVWERAVDRFSKYQFIWTEYIQWARNSGDFTLCRTLYQRAVRAVKDYPEEICNSFLSFEQQVGSISDLHAARSRVKNILKFVSKGTTEQKAQKGGAGGAAVHQHTRGAHNSNKPVKSTSAGNAAHMKSGQASNGSKSLGYKRTYDESAAYWDGDSFAANPYFPVSSGNSKSSSNSSSSCSSSSSAAIENSEDGSRPAEKRVRFGGAQEHFVENLHYSRKSTGEDSSDSESPMMNVSITDEVGSSPVAAAATNTTEYNKLSGTETGLSTTTIFAKNLSFNSTVDDIRGHFTPCGEIKDIRLVLSKAGNSRGQVFVEFVDASSASRAVEMNGSLLAGRPLIVEFASGSSDSGGVPGGSKGKLQGDKAASSSSSGGAAVETAHHPTTVFVSKLPKEVTSEKLREIFQKFGIIVEARVAVDKKTGESKCHGLVQFSEEQAKKSALAMNKKELSGMVLSILPSKFPAVAETVRSDTTHSYYGPGAAAGGGGAISGNGNKYGGAYNKYTGEGYREDDDAGSRMHSRISLGDTKRERGAAFEAEGTESVESGARTGMGADGRSGVDSRASAPAKSGGMLLFRPRALPKKT